MDLTGKVVLVTGSSQGIGAATANAFAEKGAHVAIHYHVNKAKAQETQRKCKSKLCLQADLSKLDECRKLIEKVVQEFGRIDVLVNNAGASTPEGERLSLEERWEYMMNVNLRAPFFLSQYAAPHMKKGGCIVNVSSIRALKPKNALTVYGTTKAGLAYLTKAMARDVAPEIRVNAVAPGYVRTEMLEEFYGDRIQKLIQETTMDRLIKPEEVADAVLFLCQNDAVTGHLLVVDGGYLVR